MKYLKTYEGYGKKDITSVINDAASGISDEGYNVKVHTHLWNVVKIHITGSGKVWFKFHDIKSGILELVSQLKSYDAKLSQISLHSNYESYKTDFDNAFTSMSFDEVSNKLDRLEVSFDEYYDEQSNLRPLGYPSPDNSSGGVCQLVELIFIYQQEEKGNMNESNSYWIPKRDLVNRLNRLATNFVTYVSEYNKRTKMNHNLSFTYANLETNKTLDLMTKLTINSLDTEIRSVCYEAYLLKVYQESNNKLDYILSTKNTNSQSGLNYEYYKLGDTVQELVEGTVWDFMSFLPVKQMTQEQKDDLDDLIKYNDYEDEDIKINNYMLKDVGSNVGKVVTKSTCVQIEIQHESKRDYKFSDRNFLSMLGGIFGGAIVLGNSMGRYGDNKVTLNIYLPFVSV